MNARPPLDLRVTAIEVIREGRFAYRVHLRIPAGIGSGPVLSRIDLGIERELGGPS